MKSYRSANAPINTDRPRLQPGSHDMDGYCTCGRVIRGYRTSAGVLIWVHWGYSSSEIKHRAEPNESTLRRLYGDK